MVMCTVRRFRRGLLHGWCWACRSIPSSLFLGSLTPPAPLERLSWSAGVLCLDGFSCSSCTPLFDTSHWSNANSYVHHTPPRAHVRFICALQWTYDKFSQNLASLSALVISVASGVFPHDFSSSMWNNPKRKWTKWMQLTGKGLCHFNQTSDFYSSRGRV